MFQKFPEYTDVFATGTSGKSVADSVKNAAWSSYARKKRSVKKGGATEAKGDSQGREIVTDKQGGKKMKVRDMAPS